jgi:hypothetical protein
MNLSTIEVLERAAELGLKLGIEPEDTLTVQPVDRCPPEFADTLRAYKRRLLSLLELPFVIVYSKGLEQVIFFCQDETAKAALQEAGAEEWSIYTRAELRILCEQNRIAPLSATELRNLHAIRRTFNARFTPDGFK